MNRFKNPRLMMIFSMTIFGTLGVFVRNIPVSSGELALYRAVLAAVLIALYLGATGQKIPFKNIKREVPLFFSSGVAMGINWIFLFQAYKYTTVSLATLSYYFAPVIVTVVCPFLFKEKLSGKQILCFLMSTVGLLHTGITYCLYFSALKELPGQKAAILSYIDPLVAVVISVTVLREKMTVWQAVGGLMILGFTLWNEMKQK